MNKNELLFKLSRPLKQQFFIFLECFISSSSGYFLLGSNDHNLHVMFILLVIILFLFYCFVTSCVYLTYTFVHLTLTYTFVRLTFNKIG
jgi:hypothetical protein